jgi:hypothetical protein
MFSNFVGKLELVLLFSKRILRYKAGRFFVGVTDCTHAAFQAKTDIFATLSSSFIHQFVTKTYGVDRIRMLAKLYTNLNLTYPQQAHALNLQLNGVTHDQLMSTFIIANMDQDLYSGSGARYFGGDPVVTGADPELLKRLMKEEVEHKKGIDLNITITGGASAFRARASAPSPAPAPSNDSTSPTYLFSNRRLRCTCPQRLA